MGFWAPLANQPPASLNSDSMILLTDGDVLVHNAYGAEWRRLKPDAQGNYSTGTWSAVYSMINTHQFFASGVLKNGKVFAIGGEYSNAGGDTPLAEMFDPLTNTWSQLAKPAGFDWIHGDVSCSILPDGNVLLGCIDNARTAVWEPKHDNWREAGTAFGTQAPTKIGRTNEETWTLLRDGTVIAVEVFNPNAAEKYLPHKDIWVSASSTPQNLIDTVMEGNRPGDPDDRRPRFRNRRFDTYCHLHADAPSRRSRRLGQRSGFARWRWKSADCNRCAGSASSQWQSAVLRRKAPPRGGRILVGSIHFSGIRSDL